MGIVTFVVARGAIWNAMVPIQQTPDEPEHFAYIEQLSQQTQPWLSTDREVGYNRWSEALEQSLTDSQSNRFAQQPFAQSNWDAAVIARDTVRLGELGGHQARSLSDTGMRTTGVPPLHYAFLSFPQRLFDNGNYARALWLPRLFATFIAAIGTVLAIAAQRRLLSDGIDRTMAAAPLLLLPSMGFFSMNLNADVSLLGAFAVATLLLLAVRSAPIGARWLAVSALCAVASLYLKQSGAVVAVVLAVAIVVDARRRRSGWLRGAARVSGWLAIVAIAAAPQYLLKRAASTGFLTNPSNDQSVSWPTWFFHRLPGRLETVNRGFWGVFGQNDTVASPEAQRIGAVLGLVFVVTVLSALACVAPKLGRSASGSRPPHGAGIAPIIAIPVVYVALLGLTDVQHILSGIEPLGFAQGRHLLPVLPHMAVLFAIGVAGLLRWRIPRAIALGAWIAALAAIHVDALAGTEVLRYYL